MPKNRASLLEGAKKDYILQLPPMMESGIQMMLRIFFGGSGLGFRVPCLFGWKLEVRCDVSHAHNLNSWSMPFLHGCLNPEIQASNPRSSKSSSRRTQKTAPYPLNLGALSPKKTLSLQHSLNIKTPNSVRQVSATVPRTGDVPVCIAWPPKFSPTGSKYCHT